MKRWVRTTLSIDSEVLHVLNKVPRADLPSKSKLVETLVKVWLKEHGYIVSGSSGER